MMNDLAIIYDRIGRTAEALKLMEEVVAVKRRTLGPLHQSTLKSVNNLALALAVQGQLEDAVTLLEELLESQRKIEGPESIFTLRSEYNLAIMRRYLGRWDLARPLFDDSLEILRRVHGSDHQDTLRVIASLGELLLDQRRPAEARGALRGGPHRTEARPRPRAGRDGRDHDRPRRHRTPPGSDRRGAKAGPRGRRNQPAHLWARALADALRAHRSREHRSRPGPLRRRPQAIRGIPRRTQARPPARVIELQRCMADYAWMLATALDKGYRDPRRAIELANDVIQNSPKVRDVWTTLGAAHYRAAPGTMRLPHSRNPRALSPAYSRPPTASSSRWLIGNAERRSRRASGTRKARKRWRQPFNRPGENSKSCAKRHPAYWAFRGGRSRPRRITTDAQPGVIASPDGSGIGNKLGPDVREPRQLAAAAARRARAEIPEEKEVIARCFSPAKGALICGTSECAGPRGRRGHQRGHHAHRLGQVAEAKAPG